MKKPETLEEFLARGGVITVVKPRKARGAAAPKMKLAGCRPGTKALSDGAYKKMVRAAR